MSEVESAVRRCGKCGEPVTMPELVGALSDAVGAPLCQGCFSLVWSTRPKVEPPVVVQRETKYRFTPNMGEISGFGGGYEQTCRNMLAAGLEWFDAHPEADPRFKGFKGIYGLISDDNEDAEALSKAVLDGSGGDCTGAMHQAVVGACLWIRKHGWEAYCEQMRRRER